MFRLGASTPGLLPGDFCIRSATLNAQSLESAGYDGDTCGGMEWGGWVQLLTTGGALPACIAVLVPNGDLTHLSTTGGVTSSAGIGLVQYAAAASGWFQFVTRCTSTLSGVSRTFTTTVTRDTGATLSNTTVWSDTAARLMSMRLQFIDLSGQPLLVPMIDPTVTTGTTGSPPVSMYWKALGL